MRAFEEGELPRLDARLRRVGEWLLVGYTVAMLVVTFVVPQRHATETDAPADAVIQMFVG